MNMQLQTNSVNYTSTSLIQNVWCESPMFGGIESVECSTGMEWWNGIVEYDFFSPFLRGWRGWEGAKHVAHAHGSLV